MDKKIYVYKDELYPFWHIADGLDQSDSYFVNHNDGILDVDEETYERWKRAIDHFWIVYEEIAEYYDEQVDSKRRKW
jgi:hypothetical protein